MMKYWQLRNEGTSNILKLARENNRKHILVTVGSAHQKWITDILKNEPDVVVVEFNDLH